MSSEDRPDANTAPAHLDRTLTWHEHVYRKLTAKPTPHYIKNILGLVADCSMQPDLNEPLNLSLRSEDNKTRSKTVKDVPKKRKKHLEEVIIKTETVLEDGDVKGKKKKARTTFTGRQIFELEKQFEIKKYLNSGERSEMAKLLNVTETQVKIWFQNRRTKWKKVDNISNAEAAEHKGQSAPKCDETPKSVRTSGYCTVDRHSSNSEVESDSKSSSFTTGDAESPLSSRSFKDILLNGRTTVSPHSDETLLNLSFAGKDDA